MSRHERVPADLSSEHWQHEHLRVPSPPSRAGKGVTAQRQLMGHRLPVRQGPSPVQEATYCEKAAWTCESSVTRGPGGPGPGQGDANRGCSRPLHLLRLLSGASGRRQARFVTSPDRCTMVSEA